MSGRAEHSHMKVLVVCQHYWPENFRVTEICETLVERGHQVTAVVGLPNYPSGTVPTEYKHFGNRRQEHNGVLIRRCMEIGRRPTKLGLAVNYVSYMLSACWKVLWLRRDYDVVYAYSTSPVLMSLPAAFLRCFSHKPLMIYVLDIWPACLAAMNVGENTAFYAFMKRVSHWVYGKADRLIYSSKRFQQYLLDVHGIAVSDAQYMPQFADALFDRALAAHIPSKRLQLVFAGNIGKVQAVEVLLEAAALLLDEPIHWHIVGDGSNEPACKKLAAQLHLGDAVTFHGYRPLEEMPDFYAMADGMLVSMRNDLSVNDTLPGKVQSYMAAGKPVLGSIAGETPYVIDQAKCGLCVPPENPQALADAVRRFLALSPAERECMGQRGKAYYAAHFTKKDHMDRLEAMLLELAKEGGQHARI
ncbi:MAG: glycosyltransferase family 4 protein [Clostridia bacterium]